MCNVGYAFMSVGPLTYIMFVDTRNDLTLHILMQNQGLLEIPCTARGMVLSMPSVRENGNSRFCQVNTCLSFPGFHPVGNARPQNQCVSSNKT
jgi:hypothetical protein